jgi:O-antigen ligase
MKHALHQEEHFAMPLYKTIGGLSRYCTTANVVGLIGAVVALVCLLALPGSSYWNIRLPLYLLVAFWTILRPRTALYLMPITVPWDTIDPANLGGLHASDILALLLAASWLMSFALYHYAGPEQATSGPLDRGTTLPPRYLVYALLALLLAMLASTTVAASVSLSAKEIAKWIEVLIILLLGYQYVRTRKQIWTLAVICLLAALSQAALGYLQSFFDLGPAAFVRDASLRVYGTFDQPNPYAGYINMPLMIALALCLLGRDMRTRLLAGIAAALLLGVEYLSQSKGGWMACAVALLLIIIIGMPRARGLLGAGFVCVLACVGAYLGGIIPEATLQPVLEKAGLLNISFTRPTNDNFANAERLAHWLAGIHMFQDHPFLGVGIGNYPSAYSQYMLGIFTNPLGHAHNYYINIAAEAGIFGLLTLLLFIAATFVATGRAYRAIQQRWQHITASPLPITQPAASEQAMKLANDRALVIGVIAALASVCVHNLVDDLYVHSMTNLIALLLVMAIRLDTVPAVE